MRGEATIVCWLLVACLVPVWAWAEAAGPGPASVRKGGQEARVASEEEDATAESPGATDFTRTFRLYSRRDVGLRLRPDVGFRLPPLAPLFTPETADFHGREREPGSSTDHSVAVSLSLFSADGERGSFKAQEFRDLSEEASIGIDAQYRSAADWLRLTGRHLTLDDRDLELDWRRLGVSRARLFHNRIPHVFAFGARSLYSGIGTGRLTIDDSIQQSLQDSPNLVEGAARLDEFVAGAPRVDIGLVRERNSLTLDLTAFDPVAVKVQIDTEERSGARSWSASLGLSSFVEIPWPVDYDTRNFRIEAEYQKDATLVRASFYASSFDNDISGVVFDNPWRLTDSAERGPINVFGPARGLIDLYPDNEQQEVSLTAVRTGLPGRGSLQATVSWGRLEQDDELVPFSSNTALVSGAPFGLTFDLSDPANRPAARAGARLDSRLVHLRWSARPSDRVNLEAHYRAYELTNDTDRIFIDGFAIEDTFFSPFFGVATGAFSNLPIAYAKDSYGAKLGLRLADDTRVSIGYENEVTDREFREVARTDEDRFTITVDSRPARWADLKLSYLIAERDIGEYDFGQFFRSQGIESLPILPFLRKFDQAARERDRAQVIATFYPTAALAIGAQLIDGSDSYDESSFGVLEDDHETYAVDVSYGTSAGISLFASYSFERYDVLMRGREWRPFRAGDPFRVETSFDSASNWTANGIDEIDAVVVGLEAFLIEDRLRVGLSYSYSESDGEIRYDSPVGELDSNPFVPVDLQDVDDVTWYSLHPELEYSIGERLALTLAYLREDYEILDFHSAGFRFVPVTPAGEFNGGLLMGTLPGDFDVEVFALTLRLSR